MILIIQRFRSQRNRPSCTSIYANPFALTLLATFLSLCCVAPRIHADTHYVSLSGGNIPPYTNWANAATNIQYAIDVSTNGDIVLVTNGVYSTGGRVVYGAMTNRVAITKPITVQSVNGPDVTVIRGSGPASDNAVRCAYVGTNAILSGFTLTNGATRTSGDSDRERNGGGVWCESSAIVRDCKLIGNAAQSVGGASYRGILKNSTICYNSAGFGGGGTAYGIVSNCAIFCNSVPGSCYGGGAYYSTLYNCTLVYNAGGVGGGSFYSTFYNSIAYFNAASSGTNYSDYCRFWNSCTTPNPIGTKNITNDPQLASFSHLSTNSPCIGAGSASYSRGTDIDGESWANAPSMGCDEVRTGSITGDLTVAIAASHSIVAPGYSVGFLSSIDGRLTRSVWDFGDGIIICNQPLTTHTFSTPGTYHVTLTAINETYPGGVSAMAQVIVASGTVHYVNISNTMPSAPYATWDTAATNIQDAADVACIPGSMILVGDGIYSTGGRVVYGAMTNRVAITNDITLKSINGPDYAIIEGAWNPSTTNGNAAVRCVYLGTNANLYGFTLRNGATRAGGDSIQEQCGGGILCFSNGLSIVSNCIISCNSAYYDGGGACNGQFRNCRFEGNTAQEGGGTCNSILYHCLLTGNDSRAGGGGVYMATLSYCMITHNRSAGDGGGAYYSTLKNCVLYGNTSRGCGGGATAGTLSNCTVIGNSADLSGGGCRGAVIVGCAIAGNSALGTGGGAGACSGPRNCTIVGNTASQGGGIIDCGAAYNCIVYRNNAPDGPNYYPSGHAFYFSCTTPNPAGVGNISDDPQLASASHLSQVSPCIGKGMDVYTTGLDIDGELWRAPPSIGCDEIVQGSVTGELAVGAWTLCTNVARGCPVQFVACITGRTTSSVWLFGDGITVSNQPYTEHSYSSNGYYTVILKAYNEDHPMGVQATITICVANQSIHYVCNENATPSTPYVSWSTAATNMQDAIDVTSQLGALVLVSNGIYSTGGRRMGLLTNRVIITNAITVQSVNGPAFTTIKGAWHPVWTNGDSAVRCAYIGAYASLAGFTLSNGATRYEYMNARERNGGGAWCETTALISNCVIAGNASFNEGGGSYFGVIKNCIIAGNIADRGGGVSGSTMSECDISSNTARSGGGSFYGRLEKCIIHANSAVGGGGTWGSDLNNCVLHQNSAAIGGGALAGSLRNCTIVRNFATNMANGHGGGTYESKVLNCIIYRNQGSSNANYYNGEASYCCTLPAPSGVGNITNDPQFVNIDSWNYDLLPSSPCIDQGQTLPWMASVSDIAGHPRVLREQVDMGAFEFRFESSLRAILSGAWDWANSMMHAGSPPTNAPYKVAAVVVTNVPSNAVDWVLVSVRETATGTPMASVSAFLMPDGTIRGTDGGTNVHIEAKGNLYGVLQHRNHLAVMSAIPIFTNRYVTFDFSADPNLLWGGTNSVIQVSTNRWGMIPGDADGDGEVEQPDKLIHQTQAQ